MMHGPVNLRCTKQNHLLYRRRRRRRRKCCKFGTVHPDLICSDYILSIFFLGGRHPYFHGADIAVPVVVGGCFQFCIRVEATFVGSF